MSLSSYCRVCGLTNGTVPEMSANHCDGCEKERQATMTAYAAENPSASESDKLYAGRQALAGRSNYAARHRISPRDFNRGDMETR
jgi:hypothetical protein